MARLPPLIAVVASLAVLVTPARSAAQQTSAAQPAAEAPADGPYWLMIDLSPAMDNELVTGFIRDEGEQVNAEPDRVLVTIPFRYDPAAAPRLLTRTSMKARELRGLWGVRLLPEPVSPFDLSMLDGDPLHERWELKAAAGGRPQVTARNTSSPRIGEAEQRGPGGARPDRRRPRTMTIPASGWAAIVVEVPRDANRLTWAWSDGGEATIDLGAMRKAREPLAPPPRAAPRPGQGSPGDNRASTSGASDGDAGERIVPPMLQDVMRAVTGKSPHNAALAVLRLARARRVWPSERDPAYLAELDGLILDAGASPHADVRAAAWSYFAEPFEAYSAAAWVSPAAVERLTRDAALQAAWLENAHRGLGHRPGGLFWMQSDEGRSARRSFILLVASAAARGQEAAMVKDACDLLLELAPRALVSSSSTGGASPGGAMAGGGGADAAGADTTAVVVPETPVDLAGLSAVAHAELIRRLPEVKDAALADEMLMRLIAVASPRLAADLSAEASRRGLRLAGPDDPLIAEWPRLASVSQRLVLLTVLENTTIGDVFYSPPIAKLLDDATAPSASAALRASARRLVMRIASSDLSPAEANPFPVLVLLTARDPLVESLVRIGSVDAPAVRGITDEAADSRRADEPIDWRREAAEQLLRRGLSEHAARLVAAAPAGKPRVGLTESLLRMKPPPADALAALAGFLLRRETADCAATALNYLTRRAASEPAEQRWRLLAAVRAGAHLGELDVLSSELKGPPAAAARRWLHELGHMSAQDRQRLAGADETEERIERLKEIDFRRGMAVDGLYGAVAVVETVTAVANPPRPDEPREQVAWGLPARWTIRLPELALESPPDVHEKPDAPYRVIVGTTIVGEGRVAGRPAVLGSPATFSIALTAAPWDRWRDALGPFRQHVTEEAPTEPETGPLCLSPRKVLDPPIAGTMTLDLVPLLKKAVSADAALARRLPPARLPAKALITLRYAAFGSFYGAAEVICDVPETPPAGYVYPRAAMVILERSD